MDPTGRGPGERRGAAASRRREPDLIRFEARQLPSGLFVHRAAAYVFHVRGGRDGRVQRGG